MKKILFRNIHSSLLEPSIAPITKKKKFFLKSRNSEIFLHLSYAIIYSSINSFIITGQLSNILCKRRVPNNILTFRNIAKTNSEEQLEKIILISFFSILFIFILGIPKRKFFNIFHPFS